MELGPHYALLFDYPDGTRSMVAGEPDGRRVIAGRRGAQAVDGSVAWWYGLRGDGCGCPAWVDVGLMTGLDRLPGLTRAAPPDHAFGV